MTSHVGSWSSGGLRVSCTHSGLVPLLMIKSSWSLNCLGGSPAAALGSSVDPEEVDPAAAASGMAG